MQGKISQYYIVMEYGDHGLNTCIETVQTMISKGWVPFGGVNMSIIPTQYGNPQQIYNQAMVKYEPSSGGEHAASGLGENKTSSGGRRRTRHRR